MNLFPPAHIKPKHWEEWVTGSGVHPGIVALNVISRVGFSVYDYLFYSPLIERRNTGRVVDSYLKRYQPLENGGWWCGGGQDPLTWEEMLWGQFKPDTPRTSSSFGRDFKGFGQPPKLVKYEPPPLTDLRAYFLHVPGCIWDLIAARYNIKRYYSPLALRLRDRHKSISFWEWVFLHPQIPIIITEGAKKAAALLSAGYVAIALPGISCGFRTQKDARGKTIKRHLIPELQKFATRGREFYFCFDNDPKPSTRASLKQKDDSGWYSKILLHYLLTHDPEFVQNRDRTHFEGHIERGNGRVCLWDIKGYLPKVEVLKFLNVSQWFDPEKQLSSHDPDLIEWASLVKRYASDLKDLGLGARVARIVDSLKETGFCLTAALKQ